MYENRLGEFAPPLLHGYRAKHKRSLKQFFNLDGEGDQILELHSSYHTFKGLSLSEVKLPL